MPRVVGDDVAGGALAASHLLALGHRAIGFIGDAVGGSIRVHLEPGSRARPDRRAGQDGRRCPDRNGSATAPTAGTRRVTLARRMLTAERRPTAIFTASDTQALGVIAAASEAGLHVPDDLSVIGYDDIEAADYVGLTTIRQQLFESGRRGAEILLSEIDQRSDEPPVALLAPELVVRGTTAPPKEGRA